MSCTPLQAAAASASAATDDKGEESKDKAAMDTGTTSALATVAVNVTAEGTNQDSNSDTEVNEEVLVKQVSIRGGVRGVKAHFCLLLKKQLTLNECRPLL